MPFTPEAASWLALRFALARVASMAAHEVAHAACALVLGARTATIRFDRAAWRPCMHATHLSRAGAAAVRCAGWVASVLVALCASTLLDLS